MFILGDSSSTRDPTWGHESVYISNMREKVLEEKLLDATVPQIMFGSKQPLKSYERSHKAGRTIFSGDCPLITGPTPGGHRAGGYDILEPIQTNRNLGA